MNGPEIKPWVKPHLRQRLLEEWQEKQPKSVDGMKLVGGKSDSVAGVDHSQRKDIFLGANGTWYVYKCTCGRRDVELLCEPDELEEGSPYYCGAGGPNPCMP